MAARMGSTQMAAFQVCLQIWPTTSLLADGFAIAGKAIFASAFARNDYTCATITVSRVLRGLVHGLFLAAFLVIGLHFGARLFTDDVDVLHLISVGIPVTIAIFNIVFLFILSSSNGFVGIWIDLTIYMCLRAFAGFWRIWTGTRLWKFLGR